ncbi:hypothetical protein [Leptospira interrogans]|nr:hypothetical protein [Leptospira interrogans]
MNRVVGCKFYRGFVVISADLILRSNTCGVGYAFHDFTDKF